MSISRVLCVLGLAWCLPASGSEDDKSLRFYHTHTGKTVEISYFRDGDYDPTALRRLDRFLADFRNGEVIEMDRRLFDVLHLVQRAMDSSGTFEVISAYRSPETNAMLRARSKGVAKKSLHIQGMAIDVRLSDVDTERLRDVARALEMGGVGFYARSDFVHIDVGRVRYW